MEKIRLDPDSDSTGQHILIRHTGAQYHLLIDSMDRLEQNILVFMNSLLEGNTTPTDKSLADNTIP